MGNCATCWTRTSLQGGWILFSSANWNPFRFAMLDDTAAETPHSDISNEFRRAPGSSIVAVASSLRMSQNLQLWDSFKDRTLLREQAWRNWKAGLAVQRAGKQMHTRLSKKRALDNICRLNDLSLQDWTWLQPELKKPKLKHASASSMRTLEFLKKDYLRAVLSQGELFSVGIPPVDTASHCSPGAATGEALHLPKRLP